ncbi:MAG: NADH-quinone oxidoreductase subunit N [Deltaproteobacteria bacterium]|nr:NADH-quinone oxidoreductase subunit N [Deltaproteobacteria bacterium]
MPIGLNDIIAILPEIIVSLSACVLLIVDLFIPKGKKFFIGGIAILTVMVAAFVSFYIAGAGLTGMTVFSGMFAADGFGFFFKGIFFVIAILVILLSLSYVDTEGIENGEYYIFILFSLAGMMVMASGVDLLSIYLGLELMSLPVYILTGYAKLNKRSNEAAMKYVVLGAFSSGILLFGISLIYGITGTTELTGIATALSAGGAEHGALIIAVVMLVAGFGFKIAGVPFHMWSPDVYEGAPTPITAFMSVGPKAAAFAVILRVFLDGLAPAYDTWYLILSIVAVGSMVVGNIVAIAQTNLKRMLAYSSIGHAGYALLGVIAGGEEGVASVMYYMLVYAFMNLGIFAVMLYMRTTKRSGELISDYTGLAKKNAPLAFVMLLFLFSLAGIPPTAGFIGKFYVFMALIHAGHIYLAVIGILLSAVAAYYYIRIIMLMYMKEPEGEFEFVRSRPILYVLTLTAVVVIILGIFPGDLLSLAQSAAVFL